MGHFLKKKIPKYGSHFQQKKIPLGPLQQQQQQQQQQVINIFPEQSLKLGTFSCQNDP